MARRWLHPVRFALLWVLGEGALVAGGILVSAYARLGRSATHQEGAPLQYKTLAMAVVWELCLYYGNLYNRRTILDRPLTVLRIGQTWGAAAVTLAVLYYWFPSLAIGRGVMGIALCLLPAMAFTWRLLLGWALRRRDAHERLVIVGATSESLRLAQELHDRRDELALEIVGFVDPDRARVGTPLFNPSIVGALDNLEAIVREQHADRIAISTASMIDQMPVAALLRMRFAWVTFHHLTRVYEEYTGKLAIEALTPMALMLSAGFNRHSWLSTSKRAGDILIALVGLILASPLMLVAAALSKATSRGPVFYQQTRVGENGRLFTIHKFRTMRVDAERDTGPVWAVERDDRVTRVGRVLRRTRFDEVPQLWDVLRGVMSVVGPRPERPEIDARLLEQIPLYAQRRLVRPGITGWAQVRYSYGDSVLDARVKLQYDLFYVKNMSIALDIVILLMTTKTILWGGGAR